jgi:twitching motility protein PilI
MANREALRELQTRLASRLQTAQSEGMSVAWLAVKAGGKNFLLPLGQSGEIFPFTSLQPVPYAKEWFRGVLNVRGSLLGVVDLVAFVDGDSAARSGPVPGAAPVADASVVTLNELLQVNCALLVDSLSGLRGGEAFQSSAEPAAGAPDYFGHRFVDLGGESWQEINLRSLSQSPLFLNISA